MGAAVGCGAHLAEIVRTAVGEFTLDQAVKLEDLERAAAAGDLARYVIPLERLLPNCQASPSSRLEKRVRHGSKFNVQIAQIQPGRANSAQGATAELIPANGTRAPARFQPAGTADRHRRSRCAAYLPACRCPRSRGLNARG